MRLDWPRLHGRSLCCCAWLLAAICLAGGRALAQDASTNDQPAVVNAAVEPDAEINTWLANAMQALRAGNQDAALPLLLRVMQVGPEVMASTNGVTFLPARKLAGALMRALPERTLAAYRLRSGAPAMGIPDQSPPPTDLATLEASYRSGLSGDAGMETGFRLTSLYLDQERFADARRVLLNVLDEAPSKRVPRSELLARLVVACARVGDTAQAEWAWAEIQKAGDTNRWAFLAAEIRSATTPVTPASNAWTMAYGGPAREAAPALSAPDFGTNGEWILRWGLNLGSGLVREGVGADNGQTNLPPKLGLSRAFATACMMEQNQRPSDDLIFAGNRAWINGFGECVVADLDTGRALQRTAHLASDSPAYVPYGSWVFGKRLNRAASLIGNRVYAVEDSYRSSIAGDALKRWNNSKQAVQTLPCGNVLAAYAADTGRLLWRIGREVPPSSPAKTQGRWQANAIRFAAAPVACGGLLLAPVEDSSGLGVVGLDPESGAAVWRTRLDECNPTWAPRASTVSLTMDGATAYLCNGRGSVCALDGTDGSVRWTALYESLADTSTTNPVSLETKADDAGGALPAPVADGLAPAKPEATWEENLVLVAGETVVALPEDSDHILAHDRRNGTRLWTRRKPDGVDYVVGRCGPALIVAGRRTVACVDLTDGLERWRTPIAGSSGRGALCGQEVLIPKGRTILRLRAEDGTVLASVRAQTMDNVPLGNLYVNGDQLLVAGLERLYALVDARPTFARLAERLAKEPTAEAYAERSRLYAGLERYTEALTDLREVWKRQPGSAEEESARAQVLTEMKSATAQEPGTTEALYAAAVGSTDRSQAIWRLAQYRERTGNTNGALTLYAAIFTAPDVAIPLTLGDANGEVLVRRLAAQRIRTLVAGDEAKGWKLLAEPAAQALARLGPTPACTALVEVALFFPGTTAGQAAAFKAAQLATGRGDLGTAEAILQRALLLSPPPARVAVAEELVRLYTERMKWPQGVLRLRDQWPRLGTGAPAPEFLERAAAAQRAALAPPLPPWRLRWRGTLAGDVMKQTPAGLVSWDRQGERAERHASRGVPLKPTPIGCLALDTGALRWQRDIQIGDRAMMTARKRKRWDDLHLLRFPGEMSVCVDMWSGAATTNRVPRIEATAFGTEFPAVSRIGLSTTASKGSGGVLVNLDVLTGRVAWRCEADTLAGPDIQLELDSSSPAGAFLAGRTFMTLDPWTGAVAAQRSVDSSEGIGSGWRQDIEFDTEQGPPVFENQRLIVKNLRTGATVWTLPPDLVIGKHQVMPNGMVLVQTEAEELLLLNGKDGKILRRTDKIRFAFDRAVQGEGTDAVIAIRQIGPGTNEVLVLDPAVNRIAFQGRLPPSASPLSSLGPTMPDQLLVNTSTNSNVNKTYFYQSWIQVINAQGENTSGWRLPRTEDLRDAKGSYKYDPYFAGGLILLVGQGEVLAYEHDPGDGGKKP
jgi:outer membrane protein assembly factor BamB